jgi:hypothetical protein
MCGSVGVVYVREENGCAEALQELEDEAIVRPGLHGQAIGLEGCGAIDEVPLAGDSCLAVRYAV